MPPTHDYIARSLARAENEGATCLLVEVNTPGGEELGVLVATLWGLLALLLKPYGRQSSERPFRPCR